MKNFIYLVQGRSDLVKTYYHLAERDGADALFLTYDKQIDNAVYFPDSTWSEGRNKLLKAAKEKGDFLYYIFCDDDIEFVKGGWDDFEQAVLKYKPAIGCPVFPKTRKTPIPFLESQLLYILDQQLVAYHTDLIIDGLILPYQQHLDSFSWWGSGAIENLIIENFYSANTLQFNNIRILNTQHGRYDRSNSKNNYQKCLEWFGKECKNGFDRFILLKEYNKVFKLKVLFHSLMYIFIKKQKNPDYRINNNKLVKFFKDDSLLLKQYRDNNKFRIHSSTKNMK